MIKIKYKNNINTMNLKIVNDVPYLAFQKLEETGKVINAFSTRLGGVSTGDCTSMNFNIARGDTAENVIENYERIANTIGVLVNSMVTAKQTHTTNIKRVTKADCGKGIFKISDYNDIDGLITNEKGITLVTSYADCVPLYFYDKKNNAIGLSHAGWRGTAENMAGVTVSALTKAYRTNPKDIIACIGPSICSDCYEVGEEVADRFKNLLTTEEYNDMLIKGNTRGKYKLNLWKVNKLLFQKAGISEKNIYVTNICTACNPDILFSHRASKGKRGNLAAFLALK
jgi:uncharacterized protein, YfiH family